MAITIHIAPYVHGPKPNGHKTDSAAGNSWKRWLNRFRRSPASPAPSPPDAVTGWAFRVTNYRQLRAAGVACVIATPSAAAGVSSHLDLEAIEPSQLREADVVVVETGQTVPADGTIIEGTATVDESSVTGQSAAAIRSFDRDAIVLRDSRVVTGQILVQVAARRGHPLDWIDRTSDSRMQFVT